MNEFGFKQAGGAEPGGGSLSNEIIATVDVGGVDIGDTFAAGTTIQAVLEALMAPYVEPSMSGLSVSLTPSSTYLEVGQTVTINSASWSVVVDSEGNPPQNMYLTGDGFNKAVTGTTTTGTGTTVLNTAGSKTWSLSGEDKNANPLTPATTTKSWRFRNWFGATNAANPVSDATASALALALQQSQLLTGKAYTFTCTADNDTLGNYTWIVYPASYGALSNIIMNGALSVLTAFTYIGAWNVTNAYSVIESYRFYKSNADKAFASGTTLAIS